MRHRRIQTLSEERLHDGVPCTTTAKTAANTDLPNQPHIPVTSHPHAPSRQSTVQQRASGHPTPYHPQPSLVTSGRRTTMGTTHQNPTTLLPPSMPKKPRLSNNSQTSADQIPLPPSVPPKLQDYTADVGPQRGPPKHYPILPPTNHTNESAEAPCTHSTTGCKKPRTSAPRTADRNNAAQMRTSSSANNADANIRRPTEAVADMPYTGDYKGVFGTRKRCLQAKQESNMPKPRSLGTCLEAMTWGALQKRMELPGSSTRPRHRGAASVSGATEPATRLV